MAKQSRNSSSKSRSRSEAHKPKPARLATEAELERMSEMIHADNLEWHARLRDARVVRPYELLHLLTHSTFASNEGPWLSGYTEGKIADEDFTEEELGADGISPAKLDENGFLGGVPISQGGRILKRRIRKALADPSNPLGAVRDKTGLPFLPLARALEWAVSALDGVNGEVQKKFRNIERKHQTETLSGVYERHKVSVPESMLKWLAVQQKDTQGGQVSDRIDTNSSAAIAAASEADASQSRVTSAKVELLDNSVVFVLNMDTGTDIAVPFNRNTPPGKPSKMYDAVLHLLAYHERGGVPTLDAFRALCGGRNDLETQWGEFCSIFNNIRQKFARRGLSRDVVPLLHRDAFKRVDSVPRVLGFDLPNLQIPSCIRVEDYAVNKAGAVIERQRHVNLGDRSDDRDPLLAAEDPSLQELFDEE